MIHIEDLHRRFFPKFTKFNLIYETIKIEKCEKNEINLRKNSSIDV